MGQQVALVFRAIGCDQRGGYATGRWHSRDACAAGEEDGSVVAPARAAAASFRNIGDGGGLSSRDRDPLDGAADPESNRRSVRGEERGDSALGAGDRDAALAIERACIELCQV